MKKVLIFLLLTTVTVFMYAGIVDQVELAKQNSVTYLKATLNFEQAKNDYDKAMAEAMNKMQQLQAQQSWLQAQQNYNTSLKSFYNEFFDTYIGVLQNPLQVQISRNNLRIAEIDFDKAKNLYKSGVSTLQDLQSASSTLLQAQVSVDEANLKLQQSNRDLLTLLGKNQQLVDPSSSNINVKVPSIDDLVNKSLAIQIAQIDVQLAQMNYDSLVDPSQYTKDKYERTLKIATNQLKSVQNSTRSSYESLILSTENLKKTIQAQRESLKVAKAQYDSAQKNYKVGVASEKDLLQATNTYLTAQINLLNSMKSFLENLCSLYIDANLDCQQLLSSIFGG